MVKPSDILKATGADLSKPPVSDTSFGMGHVFQVGRIIKCAGKMGPNPDLSIDPTVDPVILIQHDLMKLLDVPLDGKAAGVIPVERADEATWELSIAQEAMDPTNPVCMICGQPPVS